MGSILEWLPGIIIVCLLSRRLVIQRLEAEAFEAQMDTLVKRQVYAEYVETRKRRLTAPDSVTEITLADGTIMHIIEDSTESEHELP